MIKRSIRSYDDTVYLEIARKNPGYMFIDGR